MAVQLAAIPTWPQYGKQRKGADFKAPKASKFSTVDDRLNRKLSLYKGDISKLAIDVVVTSTNNSLMNTNNAHAGMHGRGQGTVDGAVHNAAGPELQQDCCRAPKRDTGDVILTPGYNLPATKVIHYVGPVGKEARLLGRAYHDSLDLAKEEGLRTVAFPCIATGLNGYPIEDATRVALHAIREWLEMEGNPDSVERIILCIYLDRDLPVYESLLHTFFPLAQFKDNGDKEEEYDLSLAPSGYVGICVIFNNVHYRVDSRPTRLGSEKDAARIRATFARFGFLVDEQKDKTRAEILSYFAEMVETIDPQNRCVVCFFLAHGAEPDQLIDVNNEPVSLDDLTDMIDGKHCPRMATKPKLFFAQMCRGVDPDEYERNKELYDHALTTCPAKKAGSVPLAPELDKLVAYSTSKGRMSRRDHANGSEYINALCDVLDQNGDRWPLDRVLREVRKRISVKDPTNTQYYVCPEETNTLTKSLRFQEHYSVPRT